MIVKSFLLINFFFFPTRTPVYSGGNFHKSSGGQSENPGGAETLACGRLGLDYTAKAG